MPSPYAAAHATPQGAGDARPTALQIIHDEHLTNKLSDKVVVLTGATSGIGFETARALATTGATLFLTARDIPKAQAALAEIIEQNSDRISLVQMDNSSLGSIRLAAEKILSLSNGIVHILIANAGVMGIPERVLTEDGHETHFATNYLGHFLLFQLLKPALLRSATAEFHSRVVVVSSSAHRAGDLEGWDYDFVKTTYDWNLAYANSKLAEIYLANEIERRHGAECLHATSLHPGAINTNVARHIGQGFVDMLLSDETVARVLKSAEQGAATTVVAAVGSSWGGRGGRYLEDCEEARRGIDDGDAFGVGFVERTYDEVQARMLWGVSLGLVGLGDE
ncbi:NAD(P)-binding protein [Aspergillus californicus]